jgi:dTDP-L-rhamnose 4-epimerase
VPINISGDFRIGDIRHNYADISKIKKLLNFTPNVTFNKGINKFTSWVSQQEFEMINYDHSINEMKSKGLMK